MQSLLQELLSNIDAQQPLQFLLQRLSCATPLQLNSILLELNCLAWLHPQLKHYLTKLCQSPAFYSKNRYILHSLLSSSLVPEPQPHTLLLTYQDSMDHTYINGSPTLPTLPQQQQNTSIQQKQTRLLTKQRTHQFIESLNTLSQQTFEQLQLGLDVKEFFVKSIGTINGLLEDKVYPVICYKGEMVRVERVEEKGSWWIKTKNRVPLVLDLGFGKFIYKNDSMLGNEMVGREIISFLRKHFVGDEGEGGKGNKKTNINIKMYEIIPFDKGALYQFIPSSHTVSDIKRQHTSLKLFFSSLISQPQSQSQSFPQPPSSSPPSSHPVFKNFCQSYAGFCLLQYILLLTDRHNENIMINTSGEIFHIDLGYVFQMKVGGKMRFESAPFKFTEEYKNLMHGHYFEYWKELLRQGFEIVVGVIPELMARLRVMMRVGLGCFKGFSLEKYRGRFPTNKEGVGKFVDKLVYESFNAFSTRQYDKYQLGVNGILY